MSPRLKKLLLLAGATLFCLACAEVAVRALGLAPDDRLPTSFEPAAGTVQPVCILTERPELYVLNPRHPEVGPQGLRNEAVAIPKPAGTTRVLVLGDSIAYGMGVARDEAFPQRLQGLLQAQRPNVEVVNAGVPGYTAYNELAWYRDRGRELQPDLVVVALCLNDVVNPRLHWSATAQLLVVIPDEAIPDLEFDRDVVRAEIAKAFQVDPEVLSRRERSAFDGLALFRFFRQRTARWFGPRNAVVEGVTQQRRRGVATRVDIPTMITAEDSLSIEVLLDPGSPERRWLAGMYRQLHEAVTADGARLCVLLVPLAYQLDDGYPLVPQRELATGWEQEGMPCLDVLPAMARHPKAEMFLLDKQPAYYDVWHPTVAGHEVIARELQSFLVDRNLLGR